MTHEPKTRRGQASRERIIAGAADLVGERGVHGASLDDVLSAAGASKSQLYHYFRDKEDLVRAVVARQTARVLAAQMPLLDELDSWAAITAWFDTLVGLQDQRGCVGGCPIGSLASELADHDEAARRDLAASFDRWEGYLARGLARMRERGALDDRADPATLAMAVMASIQGGLLLTQTRKTSRPLRVALDAAMIYLRDFAMSDLSTRPPPPTDA
ncbi:MAG TPA: TetR/AcrR family transcriptional regulator [Chloroflexota bacterium]|nr:TetR/AcrR family transcriptional regulator [Chloroflexota bacterium]